MISVRVGGLFELGFQLSLLTFWHAKSSLSGDDLEAARIKAKVKIPVQQLIALWRPGCVQQVLAGSNGLAASLCRSGR
jgi:hypothetical protein